VVAVCAAALLGTSCTDEWNDHYEVASATEGISSASLWSALSEQSNLSNFVSVVKACGFDEQLGGSQTFTVFAPTNDVFSSTEAQELIAEYQAQKSAGVKDDDNTVIKQFIKNHISLYKHPISSLTNDSITMMNGKYQMLTSSAIGESPLITTNGAFSNGLLNTIGQQIEYFPNVFEYLGINENLDSVYNFINSYSVYEFNPSKSVAGGIVDGQIIYLDSVSTLKNALMSSLSWAKINDEDSTYWMLAPTNDQWNALVAEREQYFNYDNTVNKRDSLQWAGTRYSIINGTAFSRTVNPDVSFQDSAQSTNALSYSVRTLLGINNPYGIFYKPFQAGGIFANNEDVECSNGHVRIPAEWPIKPTDTFLREIITEAEYLQNQDTIINAQDPLTTVSVPSGNPFYDKISGNQYVEVVPTNTSVNPTVTFNISDVLSNVGYDVYIVFAPALAGDTLATRRGQTAELREGIHRMQRPDRKARQRARGYYLLSRARQGRHGAHS